MEVTAFAEQVLVGRTLADKLLAPSLLTDERPTHPSRLPSEPGRAHELALCTGRTPSTPLHVPEAAAERGALLHAFANHELLAIELLAQALLRFPDAPAAFRRGLVQTLREEQTHLQLYLERMGALGVQFGSRPLSGFFWRAMSGIETASGFVAHLSLTFEQANLDFAEHYRRGFAAMGDHETAAVLQTVLDDEIGHVALGLRWFERWKEPDTSLFDAHRDALAGPLQIIRAKGVGFEAGPRQQAGLPSAYIERLRTSGGSKGSAARVFWFNGAAEQEVEHGLRHTPRRSALAAVADLETVPMVFAAASDVVLVRRRPRVAFLEQLGEAGFVLPRFEMAELERSPWPAPSSLGALRELRPWGTSPRASAFGATARVRVSDPDKGAVWNDAVRPLYDKRFTVELAERIAPDAAWTEPHLRSRIVESRAELDRARSDFEALGYATRVKPPFGAAGRGHRVHCGRADDVLFVDALLRRGGGIVVEPEFDVVAQFSIRLLVDATGASVLGVGRCGSSVAGQFVYAAIGAADVGLSSEVRRWLRGDGSDPKRLERMARQVADVVGEAASSRGFRGPAGVDALLVQTPLGLRLRPLVDLNPRYTMGHVAQALRPHVSTRTYAALTATTLAEAGGDFVSWASRTEAPRFEERDGTRRLVEGVLHLTDPHSAEKLVLSLSAAGSVSDALSAVSDRRSQAPRNHRSPRTRALET
ncbi:MAG: DUF455 family protein [Nannocystales bacterium]